MNDALDGRAGEGPLGARAAILVLSLADLLHDVVVLSLMKTQLRAASIDFTISIHLLGSVCDVSHRVQLIIRFRTINNEGFFLILLNDLLYFLFRHFDSDFAQILTDWAGIARPMVWNKFVGEIGKLSRLLSSLLRFFGEGVHLDLVIRQRSLPTRLHWAVTLSDTHIVLCVKSVFQSRCETLRVVNCLLVVKHARVAIISRTRAFHLILNELCKLSLPLCFRKQAL